MHETYVVHLPPLEWFLCGNDYSGSFRADTTRGCLDQTTFNYRVKLTEEGLLGAVCFFMLPWNGIRNMSEAVIGKFEASSFGIEVAENWIRSKFIDGGPPQLNAPKMGYLTCYNEAKDKR